MTRTLSKEMCRVSSAGPVHLGTLFGVGNPDNLRLYHRVEIDVILMYYEPTERWLNRGRQQGTGINTCLTHTSVD